MAEEVVWKNCYGDIVSAKYGYFAEMFFRDVISPGLAALAQRKREVEESDEPAMPFLVDDVEVLTKSCELGYCLALQALWERQIRSYLNAAAQELAPEQTELVRLAEKGRWEDLNALFSELRGLPISDFHEYKALNMLQLLGNACRHGPGSALNTLHKLHPELWPNRGVPATLPDGSTSKFQPRVEDLNIDRALLAYLAEAVHSFWEETECIYLQSLRARHWGTDKTLAALQAKRAGRRAQKR